MALDLEAFVGQNGYALIALGLLLEGETAVVLGALAAQRGWLQPGVVLAMAFTMAWASDQCAFWLGRTQGRALLARWHRLQPAVARAGSLVARYPRSCVIGVRFAWGMRIAGPAVIGASGMPPAQFMAWSLLSASLWACTYGAAGWFFGHAAQRLLAQGAWVQLGLLGMVAVVVLGVWLWRRSRRRV
jgi:membrane protein DedA with SNARE-associated domain